MATDLESLRIMVVDDNIHMRKLLRTVLQAFGVSLIRECTDGSQALGELKSFAADILLTDWLMAPLDGINLARMVRSAGGSPNRHLPIIMVTGYASRDNVGEARDAGVDEFVAKPISARSLLERLLEVIERPRPYVESEQYFGPDRRRRKLLVENERRKSTPAAGDDPVLVDDAGSQEPV